MTRTVYLNGAFLPEDKATLPIFDRGLLFADSVYEGLGVLDGQIIDFVHHMARLRRSLGELAIPRPMTQDALFQMLMRLIEVNRIDEGFCYLQITRGAHDRDYLYPEGLTPNVIAFTQSQIYQRADAPPQPLAMTSSRDLRWARRDIKTTNLLGQVLAKQIAREAGTDEALMIGPDGFVTEGGATSFFLVRGGEILVRPLSYEILGGMTRKTMLRVAREQGVAISEGKFTLADVYSADEAFLTGASSYIEPVGHVDGRPVGDGKAGDFTLRLRAAYLADVRASFYRPDQTGR